MLTTFLIFNILCLIFLQVLLDQQRKVCNLVCKSTEVSCDLYLTYKEHAQRLKELEQSQAEKKVHLLPTLHHCSSYMRVYVFIRFSLCQCDEILKHVNTMLLICNFLIC